MTTYYSGICKVGGGISPRTPLGFTSISGIFNVATDGGGVAPVATDTIKMVPIPLNAVILDVILDVPDSDTTTNLTLSVGDNTTPARFISASTVGQAGGIAHASVAGSTQFQCTVVADNTINIYVTAGPATLTTGVWKLTVLYTMQYPENVLF